MIAELAWDAGAPAGARTAALLLDLGPVGLVRGWRGPAGESGGLGQYVAWMYAGAGSGWPFAAAEGAGQEDPGAEGREGGDRESQEFLGGLTGLNLAASNGDRAWIPCRLTSR